MRNSLDRQPTRAGIVVAPSSSVERRVSTNQQGYRPTRPTPSPIFTLIAARNVADVMTLSNALLIGRSYAPSILRWTNYSSVTGLD
jgi:hypothetical protein